MTFSGSGRPNVLFITIDQFRGTDWGAAGHPLVRTPNLDRLAQRGVRFARHYSQAAPCSPGRAALYTGTYQMNNRVVANGTPLHRRFDNVALAARRAGYSPALFGYTDQSVDPRDATGPDDPRLGTYEGVLPGFDPVVLLDTSSEPWLAWLRSLGYGFPEGPHVWLDALLTHDQRPAEQSITAFLTDEALVWLERQPRDRPFFAHLSYLQPHPPFVAPGDFAAMYAPGECPEPWPAAPEHERHFLHGVLLEHDATRAESFGSSVALARAQYYGMISHVDEQLGRLFDWLDASSLRDDTVVIVTSDHGEQLGDQGFFSKAGFFEASFHIPGIVVSPQQLPAGEVVDEFSHNVDVFPTLCDLIGLDVPAQCDGHSLVPLALGERPEWWRDAAYYEWDWRDVILRLSDEPSRLDRSLARHHLCVRRSVDRAYVQFADGDALCFDLGTDPGWGTLVDDPAVLAVEARKMLAFHMQHADRSLSDMLVDGGAFGRLPDGLGWAR